MSGTSEVQVRYYVESSWGEAPSTGNKMIDVNLTSEAFESKSETKKSGILRSDGNVAKIGRVGLGAGGPLGLEMIYGEFDTILEGLLRSTFPTAFLVSADTTIAAVNSTSKFTDSGNGFTNVIVGQYIYVSGFVNAANNGYHKVTVKTSAGDITVATTLVDESAGPAVTMKGAMLTNGVTEKSLLWEIQYGTSVYDYMTGGEASGGSFTFGLEDFVTVNMDFIGKRLLDATATQGDGSPTAASTLDSMNTVDSLIVFIDGVATTLDVVSFDFTVTPNIREKKAMGNLGAIGIGGGTYNITGNIEIHNDGNDLLTDYNNFTTKSLAIQIADGAGNAQIYDFPGTKFVSGNRNTSGQDQDSLTAIGFECQIDATLGAMIGITRVPA